MIFLIKVTIFFTAVVWWDIVKCIPHHRIKNIEKRFHFEIHPLPSEHVSFVLEKLMPFGKFELKHVIHKRQIGPSELTPVSNETPITQVADVVAFENAAQVPEIQIIEKKEEEHIPEVIITSIIKPIENSKSFSFVLPEESEVFIRPGEKVEVLKESVAEVPIVPEPIPKPEEVSPPEPVVEITPKPVIVPPPPPPETIVQNVAINTPVEDILPYRVPLIANPNLNGVIPGPIENNIPKSPLLYTDISKTPIIGASYPPSNPITEVIAPPPPPPPPPIKEPPLAIEPSIAIEPPVVKEPPVIKEETPNFFVKGSRFVLYFGSMMLQMLSQLVNGRLNLNRPLPAVLPELQ